MRALPIGTAITIAMIAPSARPPSPKSSSKGSLGSSSPPPENMVEKAVGDFAGAVIVGSVRWNPAWLHPSTTSARLLANAISSTTK